jgi:dihydroorotase-like cyclic amidohydrolase
MGILKSMMDMKTHITEIQRTAAEAIAITTSATAGAGRLRFVQRPDSRPVDPPPPTRSLTTP